MTAATAPTIAALPSTISMAIRHCPVLHQVKGDTRGAIGRVSPPCWRGPLPPATPKQVEASLWQGGVRARLAAVN